MPVCEKKCSSLQVASKCAGMSRSLTFGGGPVDSNGKEAEVGIFELSKFQI